MNHTCPATGCKQQIGKQLLMCRPHWHQVPYLLRRDVVAAWNFGDGAGTDALLAAQQAAIGALNEKLAEVKS